MMNSVRVDKKKRKKKEKLTVVWANTADVSTEASASSWNIVVKKKERTGSDVDELTERRADS